MNCGNHLALIPIHYNRCEPMDDNICRVIFWPYPIAVPMGTADVGHDSSAISIIMFHTIAHLDFASRFTKGATDAVTDSRDLSG